MHSVHHQPATPVHHMDYAPHAFTSGATNFHPILEYLPATTYCNSQAACGHHLLKQTPGLFQGKMQYIA